MSTKVGRNDPCHCGSGKKYKRCHLPLDQQVKPAIAIQPPSQEEAEPPEYLAPDDVPAKPSSAFLRDLLDKVPKKRRSEFNHLIAKTIEVAEYLESQEEIEAAGKKLELHREEFLQFLANEPAYLEKAWKLFDEERFVPLRFTAQDVRRAFEHAGGPPDFSAGEKTAKLLHDAIVFLADKDRRSAVSMNLMKHLPHYVKAGRFMEGWIIQNCAVATMEHTTASNPFLYEMFSHGYEAWNRERQAGSQELLRELGLDPARLRNMSLDEINACLHEQSADPVKKSRMKAFFDNHPEQRDLAAASIEESERQYAVLLQRDDARVLLLPKNEVEPWLRQIMDFWQTEMGSDPALDKEAAQQTLRDMIYPTLARMAQTVFTPERIAHLVVQLQSYQKDLFEAGDKKTAGDIMTAITSCQATTNPDQNYFLLALCHASVLLSMKDAEVEN